MASPTDSLLELGHLYGVFTDYRDGLGSERRASSEVLLSVLQALGADIDRVEQAPAVLQRELRRRWSTLVDPCAVAWGQQPAQLELRVPESAADASFVIDVTLESGASHQARGRLDTCRASERVIIDDAAYRVCRVALGSLPHGYHRLVACVGDQSASSHLIAAPEVAYGEPRGAARSWGVFAPIYALHSAASRGAGSIAELGRLCAWAGSLGARFVGTLPLLAAYLDDPFEPSPYSPVSRLLWNELYLDLDALAGVDPAAIGEALASAALASEPLRAEPLIDYRRQYAVVRQVLEPAARAAWASDTTRAALERYAEQDPWVADYAAFRAATWSQGTHWGQWPARMQTCLQPSDYQEDARRYHLYAQWAMHEQLGAIEDASGADLYLDLSVGVNRFGFDTWRARQDFAMTMSAGAPPDALFSQGQNWGLPPLSPARMRQQGYAYFAACVRNHMSHASMLRIDHVMGLHRMYWVPEGARATEGVYVHYHADEMYAVLCLESHRQRCALIGEDLGTVPPEVRPAMEAHGMARLHVAQFAMPSHAAPVIPRPPAGTVASLNTHDTPTFAGYWQLDDVEQMHALGLLDEVGAANARRERREQLAITESLVGEPGPMAAMRAVTEAMATSPAERFLVNLEDLWLEPAPQNVPGTSYERPNWRRKMRPSLEELESDAEVLAILRSVDGRRRGT